MTDAEAHVLVWCDVGTTVRTNDGKSHTILGFGEDEHGTLTIRLSDGSVVYAQAIKYDRPPPKDYNIKPG